MIKKRFWFLFVIGVILYLSVNFSPWLRQKVLALPLYVKSHFLQSTDRIKNQFSMLRNQRAKIAELEKKLRESQKSALLSVAFASKLNHLLEENRLKKYDPRLHPVQGLSYVKLGDFSRMWLDFPDFNRSRIYGLLFMGYAAGIVDTEHGQPIARLLNNKEMIFSVAVGKQKHLGVLFGGEAFLSVRYLPVYADIKPGDEVITSGADNIFFEGVKVGEVIDVQEYNLYKTAQVKPYASLQNPRFFYAVEDSVSPDRNSSESR